MSKIVEGKVKKKNGFKMAIKAPALRLTDLEKQNVNEIWAINVASTPSRVLITAGTRDEPAPLVLAETWLPQELTAQATVRQMFASNDFRSAVNGNKVNGREPLIKLIDPETAREILETDEAREEMEEISFKLAEIKRAQSSAKKVEAKNNRPSATVAQIMSRAAAKTYSDKNLLTYMNTHAESLTSTDLQHIVDNATNAAVKRRASEMLIGKTEKSAKSMPSAKANRERMTNLMKTGTNVG